MMDIQNYRSNSSSDSDSEEASIEDSSSDSTEDSSSDSVDDSSSDFSDENDIQEKEMTKSNKRKPEVEESWLSVLGVDKIHIELPDIASLEIKDEDQFVHMGNFENIIDKIVTVAGLPNLPTYDLDTLLFLEEGRKVLGYVIDVMGPVTAPVYIIPYSSEALQNLQLEKGMKVYCAPRSKYTKYVLLQELMKTRGSDASWVGDMEVPPEFQDFSDDEQEHQKKVSKKNNKRKHNQEQDAMDRLPIESTNRSQTGKFSEKNKKEERICYPQFRNNQQNAGMPTYNRQAQSVINPVAMASRTSVAGPFVPAFNPNIPPPNFGAPPVFAQPLGYTFRPFYGVTPPPLPNFAPRGSNFGRSPNGTNPRQNLPGPHSDGWF